MTSYKRAIHALPAVILLVGVICGCGIQDASPVSPEPAAADLQHKEAERMGLLTQGAGSGNEPAGGWVSEERISELLGLDKAETGKPSIAIEQVEDNANENRVSAEPMQPRVDGLEAARGWRAVSWSIPSKVRIGRAQKNGAGGVLLFIEPEPDLAKGKQKDKAAVILPAPMVGKVGAGMQVTFSAVCSGVESVALALALEVGPGRTYYESNTIVVNSGRRRSITLPLTAKIWKTEATSWRFESAIKPARLRSIMILLYHPVAGTRVEIDDLRVSK